jgi:hypothetical protein
LNNTTFLGNFGSTDYNGIISSVGGSVLKFFSGIANFINGFGTGYTDIILLIFSLIIAYFLADKIEGRWLSTIVFGFMLFLILKSAG